MQVSDLMSRNVVSIGTSDSCHTAMQQMSRNRIRHLPVVGRGGLLKGIVTDRDLRHHLFAPGVFREVGSVSVQTLLKGAPVSDIMSAPVICVGPTDELETAARLMAEEGIGSLPVVENDRVVGILTETDLLRQIIRADPCCCPEVETIAVSYP